MRDIHQKGNTLRNKTIQGISWSVANQVGSQVITLGTNIVLIRLLSPHEFGLLAMITVITSFATLFTDMGFGSALVQKQNIREEHLSSVFWLNAGIGLLLTLAFLVGAPLIGKFYNEPMLVPLTMIISSNFLIGSFTIVQRTMMTKAMNFRGLSLANMMAVIASSIMVIILAYIGAGVWSLAVQSVLLTAIMAVVLWKLGNWHPSLIFEWSAVKDLMGFSSNLFVTNLLNYWTRNLDYLLIGRFLGSVELGVYRNAYSLMLFPVTNISQVLSTVMFPSMSRIQDDRAKVRSVFLRATQSIALITFPLMIGLFVLAESFVLTVFGSPWVRMIPILQVFCLTGLIQSIGTLTGNLYLSQGRTDLQLRVGLILKPVALLGIIVGLRWGALGVAIGYTVASLIISYPIFFFGGRLINLTYAQVWSKFLGILGCALLMAVAIWSLGFVLPIAWPNWLRLALQISFGFFVYVALLHFFQVRAYLETKDLALQQVRRIILRYTNEPTVLPSVQVK
jgi:O-antigen/teichoic acid export membrane protein